MTSISRNNARKNASASSMPDDVDRAGKPASASRNKDMVGSAHVRGSTQGGAQGANGASVASSEETAQARGKKTLPGRQISGPGNKAKTAIACCVQEELGRYFDMLDGETPCGLYRMVIRQAEHALLSTVMRECGGNQSRAAQWLGISRGNLRNKLADME